MEQHLINRRIEKDNRNSWFSKAFLIMGLVALATALLLWIVLGRDTQDTEGLGRREVVPEIKTPSREMHHFTGNLVLVSRDVQMSVPVHMSIIIDGTSVSGKYYYDNVGLSLKLTGTKDGEGINMEESNGEKATGWFKGNLVSGKYSGNFTRAKDGALFNFNLSETGGGKGFFDEDELVGDGL